MLNVLKNGAMKAKMGNEIRLTRTLTLGLDGEVVRFAIWPLYLQGNNPLHPLNRRLHELQSHWGHARKKKRSFFIVQPMILALLTQLSLLNYDDDN
jgi:hypothetical protein